MMPGWVILATDTGVGKTHIGSRLVTASQAQKAPLFPLKPVETGCLPVSPQQRRHTRQPLWPEDGAALASASGHNYPLDEICPLRFSTPAAAPEAARAENQSLWFNSDLAPILDTRRAQPQLIETAGGLYSPVCEDALN
ncbi:MAG TPA: dethiobiotin synthase, partial [Halothiobacillaceae bacterium]|nr:dethiobiotin synthase [Halothiobacillaceae bacterium]